PLPGGENRCGETGGGGELTGEGCLVCVVEVGFAGPDCRCRLVELGEFVAPGAVLAVNLESIGVSPPAHVVVDVLRRAGVSCGRRRCADCLGRHPVQSRRYYRLTIPVRGVQETVVTVSSPPVCHRTCVEF